MLSLIFAAVAALLTVAVLAPLRPIKKEEADEYGN